MTTVADLVLARAEDDRPGLLFEDQRWTWRECVQMSADRASLAAAMRRPGPFHIGVLLENVPEFSWWLGTAALAGAVVVGINPTRRGAELERDITHTECQLVVTESSLRPLLDGLDLGLEPGRVLTVDESSYVELGRPHCSSPTVVSDDVSDASLFLLLFTSGTSGAPKAVRCTHGRLAMIGQRLAETQQLTADDVAYLSMPLFHSNALMAGWAPALVAGSAMALRRRFSASAFIDDVRTFGATYANYVGKPLSYVLATPERPDDAENPLVRVFGNEGAERDLARFAVRFACRVTDGYGSTEGGASVGRTPDTPTGSLGRGPDGTVVLDPETGEECPPARFDEHGRLLNGEAAIGELANRAGAAAFEGYWNNDEADRARTRDGIYWTGDLAYRDEAGFIYFAGRTDDWLRVDGENFAAAPVERILARHPDVVLAAVYAVPDDVVGDRCMAALQLRPGAAFDPRTFATFLGNQADLGAKQAPTLVRVMDALPVTETSKIVKRRLRADGVDVSDPVWVRGRDGSFSRSAES